jgi:flavin-dependent dehydrogenase
MSTYDLAVVGAGPAGCATAITAVAAGAKVLLLERGRFPRHKVCGEFVSAESLDLLQQLLCDEDINLISQATMIPRSRIFVDDAEIPAEINPPAASITRFDLDAALWHSCVAHGVDAREECAVRSIAGVGPFQIKTDGLAFEAKALVNATGRWSNLAPPRAAADQRWIGIKAHFSEPRPPASVDLYFFSGGYCGVQPISSESGSGAVNACAMVSAKVATNLSDVLRLHPALYERSRKWQPMFQPVTTSPLIFHDPEPVHECMLQAGDSATFVDPFIGDGISLALRSGVLAAQCLAPFFSGNATLAHATGEYRRRYRKRLSHVFRASSMLRRFIGWPKLLRRPILGFLQARPRLTRRIVQMTR